MEVKTGYLAVDTKSGQMQVYYAHPHPLEKSGTIIVLQEAFGVNEHIQDICHRFANEGYFAVAPELFHREGDHVQIDYSDRKKAMLLLSRLSDDSLAEDIGATINYLSSLNHVDVGKMATVGFCMGGYASLLASTRFPISTAVSFYGAGVLKSREGIGFGPLKEELCHIECPILLFFGENDASIPLEEIREVKKTLDHEGVSYRSMVFKNSNHGFFCDQRGSYNPQAAQEAWKICLEWLSGIFTSVGTSGIQPGKDLSQDPSGLF